MMRPATDTRRLRRTGRAARPRRAHLGLDPLMEQVFNECLAEHRETGTTVLLSSHILSEVERLADRVTIIRDGPGRGDRHADRAAAPAAQPRAGRGRRAPVPGPDGAARRPRGRSTGAGSSAARSTPRPARARCRRSTEAGVRRADQHPARPSRSSSSTPTGPRRERAGRRGPGCWSGFALRRDRVLLSAWVGVLRPWWSPARWARPASTPTHASGSRPPRPSTPARRSSPSTVPSSTPPPSASWR